MLPSLASLHAKTDDTDSAFTPAGIRYLEKYKVRYIITEYVNQTYEPSEFLARLADATLREGAASAPEAERLAMAEELYGGPILQWFQLWEKQDSRLEEYQITDDKLAGWIIDRVREQLKEADRDFELTQNMQRRGSYQWPGEN